MLCCVNTDKVLTGEASLGGGGGGGKPGGKGGEGEIWVGGFLNF